MPLWNHWLNAVQELRPACSRARTFLWMLLALASLCSRADNAGVASFVRVLNFRAQACHRFLHLFHSDALHLDVLTSCWVRLCLKLFRPFEVGSRLVLLADGIKAPKEGKRMPGVKMLHQQSASTPTARIHHGAFFASCFLAGAFSRRAGGGRAAGLPDSRGAGVLQSRRVYAVG